MKFGSLSIVLAPVNVDLYPVFHKFWRFIWEVSICLCCVDTVLQTTKLKLVYHSEIQNFVLKVNKKSKTHHVLLHKPQVNFKNLLGAILSCRYNQPVREIGTYEFSIWWRKSCRRKFHTF